MPYLRFRVCLVDDRQALGLRTVSGYVPAPEQGLKRPLAEPEVGWNRPIVAPEPGTRRP